MPKKIVVIEDNKTNIKLIRYQLEVNGYQQSRLSQWEDDSECIPQHLQRDEQGECPLALAQRSGDPKPTPLRQ